MKSLYTYDEALKLINENKNYRLIITNDEYDILQRFTGSRWINSVYVKKS